MCCKTTKFFPVFIPIVVAISTSIVSQTKQERPPKIENPAPVFSAPVAVTAPIPVEPPAPEAPSVPASTAPAEPTVAEAPASQAVESSTIQSEVVSELDGVTVMQSVDAPAPTIEPKLESPSQPVLPEDRPDWVGRSPVITDGIHFLSVGGELASTYEQSLKSIDQALVAEARNYLNQHVLPVAEANKLEQLTADWIRENWMVKDKTFDAITNRPSGEYHQAWVELQVSLADREVVKSWWQETERERRVKQVGGLAVFGILGVGVLRTFFGFASRKSRQGLPTA